jgi:hypothetical protein
MSETKVKTCKVVRRLVDVRITCDKPFGVGIYAQRVCDMEGYAKALEVWVKEFDAFIRDHRSQDPVTLTVEREFKDVCSECGEEYEEETGDETGKPYCAYCGAWREDAEEAKRG